MSEIHDAAAAYALDALDVGEQEEFERHLASCAACAAEVEELREVAAGLVLSSSVPLPPPDLRASVLAGIVGVEQLPAVAGRPRRAMHAPEDVEPEVVPVPVAASPEPAVDELALRRLSRRARLLSVLVAAVSVVALALGGVVYSLARQGETPPVATPPVTQTPAVDRSLLSAPDVKIVKTKVKGVDVAFVVSKRQNRAAFVSTDLPDPGAGLVYHLWTLKGSVARPDTIFPVQDQGTQAFTGPVDDSTRLAINVEPAGTAPQAPTSTPLAYATV